MNKSIILIHPYIKHAYKQATLWLCVVLFFFTGTGLLASPSLAQPTCTVSLDTLPSVFMIGQHEEVYEELVTECSNPLLTVCQDSMDLAYRRWMTMLSEMEQYAEKSDFDIKGIKIWLNIFWNADGTIRHLVYFPKPNSRNMDFDLLTRYLAKFVEVYKMESLDRSCFSHYGSAAFPTFAEIYLNKK